jgi:ABC-type multidrug transport system ATPase subunit
VPEAIDVEQLTRAFNKHPAVRGLSFSVGRGEICAFLGPNGAGKTTTIRMMLGLLRPDSGSVRILGANSWTEHLRASARVGSVSETPALYPFLTVRENIRLIARVIGRGSESTIDQLLALAGLEGEAGRRVSKCSLGQRQRLAIAQALVGDPDVLILDEPLNGLDPAGMQQVRRLLRALRFEYGKTIFVSSHLLREVEDLCQRVVVINHGTLVRQGSLAEFGVQARQTSQTVRTLDQVFLELTDAGAGEAIGKVRSA